MSPSSVLTDAREKFQRLTQREQLLVVGVVITALYFLFDTVVFSSQMMREKALEASQRTAQAQVVLLSAQIAAVQKTRSEEMDQKAREFAQLKAQVKALDQMVAGVSDQAPAIKALIGDMVDAQTTAQVDMVSVKTLPVKSVQGLSMPQKPAAAGAVAANKAGPLYKHGIELTVRGRYLDLMAYLEKLEEAHPTLLWSDAVLTAETYPLNTLRVVVFLLSSQPNP